MTIKGWSNLKSRILGDYKVFRLREDLSRSPRTGRDHSFYVLETADWINVIPVTSDGRIVLIRQYRHGTDEITLEVPGGMVDSGDGSPKDSAARELLEETGYVGQSIHRIGLVAPNPAILNNHCYTFLALDVVKTTEPQLDGSEDIEVEIHDLESVQRMIAEGQITHALTIAAFYFYDRELRG